MAERVADDVIENDEQPDGGNGDAADTDTGPDADDVPGTAVETDSDGGDGTGGDAVELDESDAPRRARTALAVSLVLAVLAVGFVIVLATREPATDRQANNPLLGQPAPAVEGETVGGGNFGIGEYQGRWVVVNFFATWCVPCRQEHPELVSFDEANSGDTDPVLVSVVYDDDVDDVQQYFADNGGDWPLVLDPDVEIALDYAVTGVPETFVINPDGLVIAFFQGVTRQGIERVIAEYESGVGS
jgi:cytochrome c biogenesis protein CcmG, thiol:disulfide interchange protein DsbE